MTSSKPIRVLTIGPAPAGPDSRGGMASVIRLLVDDPDPRFAISSVSTFVDTGAVARQWTGVRGMVVSAALILSGRADVVHVHLAHGGSVVRKSVPLLAARLRGVPAIVHGHSFNFSGWFDRLPPAVRRLARAALHADQWLVLGAQLAREYRRSLVLPHDKVQVLYNPVVIPAATPPRAAAPPHLTVLSLGRLGERKGTYDLIEAITLLPSDIRTRLRLILAGDGEVEKVRARVAANDLGDVIDVVGWIDPVTRDELLGRADIFVLPSYEEGLPMAILEAMAHGVVPLTTPVGGIPDAVTDGVEGLLVPPGQPADLASALRRLTEDDELRRRLGAAARERAQIFGIAGWRAELAQLWLSLAARRPG
ncbi:glycosyltransferase family 4 protein [Mycolicibacterium sp.]|uniref:glycosyltransferase family 4 protein n=1 Tax=Mycolicibacterium sp. TaxID=2320850 RepID=UPI0037CA8B81